MAEAHTCLDSDTDTPCTLWMLQRVWDTLAALSPAGRRCVDETLAGTGCEALLDYRPRHRLGKWNFQLVFESGGGGS